MKNKEALKLFSSDIQAEFSKWLESPSVKDFIEQTKANEESGTFEVVITTESVDRMGEVIKADGWELENYMKNPVVLWGHDHYTLPIGVATSIEKVDNTLVAKGKFAPSEFAQQIRKLYDAGIVRATSVGFIEKERQGNLITKAELLEFSFVSVPANPMCLSTLIKSGISVNDMVTKGLVTVAEKEEDEQKPKEEEAKKDEAAVGDMCQLEDGGDGVFELNDEGNMVCVPKKAEPAEEKKFASTKEVTDLVTSLKTAIIALEDLVSKSQEPERNLPVDESELKAFQDFSAKRKILQDASTVIGEVLAEARQAIEARK